MPTYIVKPEKSNPTPLNAIEKDRERYPTVRIDVSSEIIRSLEIGQDVTVTLSGKIVGLSENLRSENSRSDLEIELRKVEAYPSSKEEKKATAEKSSKKDSAY